MEQPEAAFREGRGIEVIAIIDYDAGNIRSVQKACTYLGRDCVLTKDPGTILSADHVILPGVGAFADAMGRLRREGMEEVLRDVAERGIPLLGICLGLQLLFERSDESLDMKAGEDTKGLSLLSGQILRIPDDGGRRKIPHMGWNSLHLQGDGRLFQDIQEGAYVYFVHSYYLRASDPAIVKATAEYGAVIDASVEMGNVFATQFHPEKSGAVGLKILGNFLNL